MNEVGLKFLFGQLTFWDKLNQAMLIIARFVKLKNFSVKDFEEKLTRFIVKERFHSGVCIRDRDWNLDNLGTGLSFFPKFFGTRSRSRADH